MTLPFSGCLLLLLLQKLVTINLQPGDIGTSAPNPSNMLTTYALSASLNPGATNGAAVTQVGDACPPTGNFAMLEGLSPQWPSHLRTLLGADTLTALRVLVQGALGHMEQAEQRDKRQQQEMEGREAPLSKEQQQQQHGVEGKGALLSKEQQQQQQRMHLQGARRPEEQQQHIEQERGGSQGLAAHDKDKDAGQQLQQKQGPDGVDLDHAAAGGGSAAVVVQVDAPSHQLKPAGDAALDKMFSFGDRCLKVGASRSVGTTLVTAMGDLGYGYIFRHEVALEVREAINFGTSQPPTSSFIRYHVGPFLLCLCICLLSMLDMECCCRLMYRLSRSSCMLCSLLTRAP